MNRILLATVVMYCCVGVAYAQHIYVSPNDPVLRLADRLQTLYGSTGDSVHTHTGFTSYGEITEVFRAMKTDVYNGILSNSDIYDISKTMEENSTFGRGKWDKFLNLKEPTNTYTLYSNTPYLIERTGAVDISIQPQAALMGVTDMDHFYTSNSAGLELRANVGSRLGIYLSGTYCYEILPDFYQNYANRFQAYPFVPRFNTYSLPNDGKPVGYFWLNGEAAYDIIPRYATLSLGYRQFFVGDGIRSLILSDFAAPMPFASLRFNIWKLQYTSAFFMADNQTINYGFDDFGTNKFISYHSVSANLFSWLNLSLFETVTTSKSGGPEIGYFNPVIFYRALERAYGSPDKMAIGAMAKAVVVRRFQFYGQFFLNEFKAKEFFAGNGYKHNKWGLQLGAKYFNVLGIDNLDLQLEGNVVRPYSYQHRSTANFSHGNMPLAHPLGAGFKEGLVRIDYRPHYRIHLTAQAMIWQQGLDTGTSNYGSNVLNNIRNTPGDYGVKLIHGVSSVTQIAKLNAAYEVLPRMFVEVGGVYRKQTQEFTMYNYERFFTYLGIRFYMQRRDWFQF